MSTTAVGLLREAPGCLVTGAASGIGRAAAVSLASRGARVTLVDLDPAAGASAVEEIVRSGGAAQFVQCDVTNSAALAAAFDRHGEAYGRLDVCVLNAGVGWSDPDFRQLAQPGSAMEQGRWRRMMDINLNAVIEGTWLAAARMRRDGGGTVLVTASAAGIFPGEGLEAYAASKGGAVHWARSCAWMQAAHNIRVCALCPQFTDTPLVEGMGEKLAERMKDWRVKRLLTQEEVVGAMLELLADGSRGGGAVMAVMPAAGRVYWDFKGSPKAPSAMRGPQGGRASEALAAWAVRGGRSRKVVCYKLSPDFRDATRIVDGVAPAAPVPAGRVLVRRLFTGVNASDINFTQGRYFGTPEKARALLPFDVGFESVGIVAAVCPAAAAKTGLTVGSTVATLTYGGFSDYALLSARNVVPVPEATPQMLALLVSGLTASIGLEQAGRMRANETVLVTAAAGGTGMFAVQLAKLAGNHVVATCGSAEKADLLRRLGADRVINYRTESVKEVLKREYPKGLDLVYESVGGDMFKLALNALADKGRLVIIGMMSQYTAGEGGGWAVANHPGLPEKLLNKSAAVTGFFLPHYAQHNQRHLARLHALMSTGQLQVAMDPTPFIGLESVPDAVQYLQSGKSLGKVVVTINSQVPARL